MVDQKEMIQEEITALAIHQSEPGNQRIIAFFI